MTTNVDLENKYVAEIDFVDSKNGWMTGWNYGHRSGVALQSFMARSVDGGRTWRELDAAQ